MRNTAVLFALLVVIAATVLLVRFAIPPPQPAHDPRANLKDTQPGAVLQAEAAAERPVKSRLPTRTPALVQDPRLKPLVDPSLPAGKRISPDITAKIPSVTDRGDQQALAHVLTDPTDDDTVRNEVANLLRRSKFPELTDALIQVLQNPAEKPRFRAFAVQHLWQQLDDANATSRANIESRLHTLLEDWHVEVRREALLALVRMGDPLGTETAVRLLGADDPEAAGVRDLAIRCVYELNLREHLPLIRNYARDPNVVARIAAIAALSQWGDEESRPAFEDAARSSVVRLQRAGKTALERLDQGNPTWKVYPEAQKSPKIGQDSF